MIEPHGGKLIDKVLLREERERISLASDLFEQLVIDEESIKDAKNIARGLYSPLTGFLREEDFNSVVSKMRLKSGIIWPVPIVLDLKEKDLLRIKYQKDILLVDVDKNPVALLKDIEVFPYDKKNFAEKVFGTLDKEHPGVEEVYEMGEYLIGGDIELVDDTKEPFPDYNFTPREVRSVFSEKNWNNVVAFQTRNVPHRGHEFLQKYAVRELDGLFIHPVIGRKKLRDFKDEFIISSYETLIDNYYSKERVFLGILPLKMRYAGPREAVFHALIRKNFGCSHFIVGRDHAGCKNYYDSYAAQRIFDDFTKEEIGINILKLKNVIYCKSCQKHVFEGECNHPEGEKISFSGTRLREYIEKKEEPPFYILRSKVYRLLLNSLDPLVDNMYNNNNSKQRGFVLWFTGLSGSGKSTIADRVFEILREKGIKTERLDGDIVRQSLTRDLGFSKEDRDENIKRVGFVAQMLSKNRVGVLASFISPYKRARQNLRESTTNFIEVYCRCPLWVCEERDVKGLYDKAKKGEIENFTGVSDPYEEPENPEIVLNTDKESIEECTDKVIKFLTKNNFIHE